MMGIMIILKHKSDNSFVFVKSDRTDKGIEIIEIKKVEKQITTEKRTIQELSVLKTEGFIIQVTIPIDVWDKLIEMIMVDW